MTWYERPLFENPFARYPKERAFLPVKPKTHTPNMQTWDLHRHHTWDEAQWWIRTESISWQLMEKDIGVTEF